MALLALFGAFPLIEQRLDQKDEKLMGCSAAAKIFKYF